jgi:hypothetical protein
VKESSPVLSQSLLLLLSSIEISLGVVTLILLIRTRELKTYWPMLGLATWQTVPYIILLYLKHLGPSRITAQHAYFIYFHVYWTAFAVQAVCAILLTYTVFEGTMRPLKGLQRLGRIVYFWAAAISVFVAVSGAIAPTPDNYLLAQALLEQFQRSTGIMTVSLVVFVFVAIRPMGLSLKSRIFGSGLGLIILSVTTTLQASFIVKQTGIYSFYGLIQIAMSCIAELVWIYYFARPEPKRQFVLLPTTSPFHRWNQISELLGQDPGYVAIGGVPPDAFSAAEIEVFHRASAKMNALGTPEEVGARE